jgi:hypothetical protein
MDTLVREEVKNEGRRKRMTKLKEEKDEQRDLATVLRDDKLTSGSLVGTANHFCLDENVRDLKRAKMDLSAAEEVRKQEAAEAREAAKIAKLAAAQEKERACAKLTRPEYTLLINHERLQSDDIPSKLKTLDEVKALYQRIKRRPTGAAIPGARPASDAGQQAVNGI